jgi:hypothetical protein
VLDRIEVGVIDVFFEVGIISNGMLPKPPLLDSFFTSRKLAWCSPCVGGKSDRKIALDEIPAQRKISVILRRGPNRMEVLRQHADRNRFEWIFVFDCCVSGTKAIDFGDQEVARAVRQRDRKEEHAAFD